MDDILEKLKNDGYTICRSRTHDPDTIVVWKGGFYGAFSKKTGEELTPCVHISTEEAAKSAHYGIQKTIKDSLKDGSEYSPYKGAIVTLLLDQMAILEPISNGTSCWQSPPSKENLEKIIKALYVLVDQGIENGGMDLLLNDHGSVNPQFDKLCDELRRLTGIEDYSFDSALSQKIEFKKVTIKNLEYDLPLIGQLENMKPRIIIGKDKTMFYPDSSDPDRGSIVISEEDYKKGVQHQPSPFRRMRDNNIEI